MGLVVRKRIKLDNGTYLNLSKSGVSLSKKIGNVTVNIRSGVTINLGKGVSYKIPMSKVKKVLNVKNKK